MGNIEKIAQLGIIMTAAFIAGFSWAASAHGSEISGPFSVSGTECGTLTLTLGPEGQNEYRIEGCPQLEGVVIGHVPLPISATTAATARDQDGNFAFAVRATNTGTEAITVSLAVDPQFAALVCASDELTAVCLSAPADTASQTIPAGEVRTFSGFGNSADPTELALMFSTSDGRTKIAALEVD